MGATGLSEVRARIESAAARAGRSDPVRVVIVTKYASDEAIRAVVGDGGTELGESRAQQLVERAARFGEARWHFVGRLQRNKVGLVRPAVDLLHSMDRARLAASWIRDDDRPPPVLVQVNLAAESQKGGVAPPEAQALVEECRRLGIEVRGLMTVPPRPERPGDSARWFAALRGLRERIALDHPEVVHLSMGMSDDYEVAVEEGATILRIGRAIFEPFPDRG
jgi:pyridoxal phosphate enzyme (YggS family)